MRRAASSSLLLQSLLKSSSRPKSLPRLFFTSSYSLNLLPVSSQLLNPSIGRRSISGCCSRGFRSSLPSSQRQLKEKAFELAAMTDEILTSSEALEAVLDENDKALGLACLKVGQHLDSIGSDDHEKILTFGLRALKILDVGGEASVSVAMALHLVGCACYNIKRFNDSFGKGCSLRI
ncbi:hypothetical protein AXF42_Ash019907 [Apostasia shenzhenica]|uniref:Uncharacterized protein n=1 Tax=Apostasia shenzhenica TaxID=1088818 RepID=A0A2H9ZYS2_9ASPA|nr:hypothetical protein AXF42_Ash019907 [Apostasia shenzhenica]